MNDNGFKATDADWKEIARQLEVELGILLAIERSLRLALQWMTRDRGNFHKLSTLRFAARSFERHLVRTRVLADHGGYRQLIGDKSPHLTNQVSKLRDQCEKLQAEFEEIILQLEYVSPDDKASFDRICDSLGSYLDNLEAIGQEEMDLLQQSFIQELGGEG